MPRTKEGTNHAKPAACSQTAVFRALQKNAVHELVRPPQGQRPPARGRPCQSLEGQGLPPDARCGGSDQPRQGRGRSDRFRRCLHNLRRGRTAGLLAPRRRPWPCRSPGRRARHDPHVRHRERRSGVDRRLARGERRALPLPRLGAAGKAPGRLRRSRPGRASARSRRPARPASPLPEGLPRAGRGDLPA